MSNPQCFPTVSQESEGSQVPCRAKLNLSDLRIPLMWKDTDHFKNKGGTQTKTENLE